MLRNYPRGKLGGSQHTWEFLQQRPGSPNKNKENQMSQINKINAFPLRVNCKVWTHEVIPLTCTSAIWGQYPVFSHPESPQGVHLVIFAAVECLMAGILISFWDPWELTSVVASVWWLNGCCNTLCLPIWQAAFLVHKNDFDKLVKYQQTSRQ